MVTWRRIGTAWWDDFLHDLVTRHVAETQSRFAARLLNDWDREAGRFWHVVPRDFVKYLPQPLEAEDTRGRRA
jgi:glutamate synthase (NADPH/NADH) large chain